MTEHDEQAAFMQWLKLQHPRVEAMTFAVPNGSVIGGKNKYALIKKLKKEGMKNGVPDLFCLYPHGGKHGLVIEMKAIKGGRISDEQLGWRDRLVDAGFVCVFCNGCQAAITATRAYLAGG